MLIPEKNRKSKIQTKQKNNMKPPFPTDPRVLYVPIACGECMECKKRKAREWKYRILEDIKTNNICKFTTLTFSNESIKK